jgi:predicted outer membrane repeat protein
MENTFSIGSAVIVFNLATIGLQLEPRDTVTVTESTFSSNTAFGGGAISFSNALEATIEDCSFIENSALAFGGAVASGFNPFADDPVDLPFVTNTVITDSEFIGNSAGGGLLPGGFGVGGAINHQAINLLVEDCDFENNEAANRGGAIALNAPDTTLTIDIDDNDFEGNSASAGGAIIFEQDLSIAFSGGQQSDQSFIASKNKFKRNIATNELEGNPMNPFSAPGIGGGIFAYGLLETSILIEKNKFIGNEALNNTAGGGGAIGTFEAPPGVPSQFELAPLDLVRNKFRRNSPLPNVVAITLPPPPVMPPGRRH